MRSLLNRALLAIVAFALLAAGGVLLWRAAASPVLCDECNIILVALDGVSGDTIEHDLPSLTAHARKEGVIFTQAYSSARRSISGQAALLTGAYPWDLGIWDSPAQLPADTPTLAETLAAYGYSTAGIVQNALIDSPWGFERGFATWKQVPRGEEAVEQTFSEAERFIAQQGSSTAPYFLYLQPSGVYELFDAEGTANGFTYGDLAAGYAGDGAAAERLQQGYRAKLMHLDARIEALAKAVEGGRKTIVVVTAGYGQEFIAEPTVGAGRGTLPRARAFRVPLLFFMPGLNARSIDATVENRNVAQTILTLVGAQTHSVAGVSMVPYLHGSSTKDQMAKGAFILYPEDLVPSPQAYFEDVERAQQAARHMKATNVATQALPASATVSLITGAWHAIERPGHAPELYDFRKDPAEEHDLSVSLASLSEAARKGATKALMSLTLLRKP